MIVFHSFLRNIYNLKDKKTSVEVKTPQNYLSERANGMMFIVTGNGLGDPNSDLGEISLLLTLHWYLVLSFLFPVMDSLED